MTTVLLFGGIMAGVLGLLAAHNYWSERHPRSRSKTNPGGMSDGKREKP